MSEILFIIPFIAIEALIFILPARIPMVKQWAVTHRVRRWIVIGVLSLLPALVNYVGLVWSIAASEIMFASWSGFSCRGGTDGCYSTQDRFERDFNLDFELQDELVKEIALRRLFLREDGYCFSNNSAVCDSATNWLMALQEWREKSSIYSEFRNFLFIFILTSLPTSFLTGYFVHRITRDNRKQKRG